ncbi:uncharacterized protein [Onthophagus taurus]|uniref:uncharacterized protein n=1 Tax=Onthophagus taurus TaxID=166361 RepID=UPI000C204A49|nr:uncharacterized protein LOC111416561 [Onthophagus taurus]
MGCSASKNLTVELQGDLKTAGCHSVVNNDLNQLEVRKNSVPRRASDVPPVESVEPQTEMLQENNELGTCTNVQQSNNGLSFEVPMLKESESIIKKHPPRRFQKLEEQQTSPSLSLVKLREKLDEAEIRRQQILQQRVQSAKTRYASRSKGNKSNDEDDDDDYTDDGLLKVPPDVPAISNPYDVSYL